MLLIFLFFKIDVMNCSIDFISYVYNFEVDNNLFNWIVFCWSFVLMVFKLFIFFDNDVIFLFLFILMFIFKSLFIGLGIFWNWRVFLCVFLSFLLSVMIWVFFVVLSLISFLFNVDICFYVVVMFVLKWLM